MPIESKCPGCGRTLQVADEHLGKQARCPMCNEIYQVSGDGAASSNPEAAAWRMRTPEGQTYGPISKAELDAWVSEGRVTAECLLASETNPDWIHADTVYSVLQIPAAPSVAVTHRPVARYISPHRGGLILALGIISWAVGCPIFGICAWVMGNTDLREMRAGRMDTSGIGLTQAGQVIGMIHAIICIFAIVLFVFLFLLGVGWR